MAFEFSLMLGDLTPIRPQNIERLFSPGSLTPNRIDRANNDGLRSRVLKSHLTYDAGNIIGLPLEEELLYAEASKKFPRQSTCVKATGGQSSAVTTINNSVDIGVENVNKDVATDTKLSCSSDDDPDRQVTQYRPFSRFKDTLPTRTTCFHPNGEIYVVGSNTRALRICKYPEQEELNNFSDDKQLTGPEILFKFLEIHRSSVYCTAFNSSGNLLATGSNDQTVHVIKYNANKHIPDGSEYELAIHSGTVRDVCFLTSDGGNTESSILASTGAGEFEIILTDCQSMKPLRTLIGHESTVMSLHHWDETNKFVSASLDGTIRLWDTRSNRCASMINTDKISTQQQEIGPGKLPVCSVRVEHNGKLLVSGHQDGKCMLYDLRGGRVVQLFQAHDSEIRTLNFSPKSYYLLTASYDHRVKLMDMQGDLTRKLPCVEIAELDDKIVQTAWHPIDYTFVTTSADGSAILWAMPGLA